MRKEISYFYEVAGEMKSTYSSSGIQNDSDIADYAYQTEFDSKEIAQKELNRKIKKTEEPLLKWESIQTVFRPMKLAQQRFAKPSK